jgi:methyl-accepting chemotaxis protein
MKKTCKDTIHLKKQDKKNTYAFSKWLRVLPVKQRLIIFFVTLSLTPLALLGIISYNTSKIAIKSKISTYSTELVKQLSKNIEGSLQDIQGYGNEVALSASIKKGLLDFEKLEEYEQYQMTKEIGDLISENLVAATTIDELYIYTPNNIVIKPGSNQQGAVSMDSFTNDEKQQVIKLATEAKGKTVLYYGKLANENSITFAKAIRDSSQGAQQDIGYVITRYPIKEIYNLYKDMNIGRGARVSVVNASGYVISSNNPEMVIGKPYDGFTKADLLNSIGKNLNLNNFMFNSTINGEKCLITFSYLEKYDWYVVSTIPYTYLNLESNRIRDIMLIIGAGCVIFVLLLTYFISKSISEPLRNLTYLVGEVEKGNLCVSVTDESRDEISQVIKQSNSMVSCIRTLITKVNETVSRVKKGAENMALFSEETSCSSGQIMDIVQGIAEGAAKQAEEIGQSLEQVEHLSHCIDKVSEDIKESNITIDSTKNISSRTVEVLNDLNHKATNISTTFEKIMNEVAALNMNMKEITNITSLIGNIAEQTNLLSLNASIEAARVGAAGRGFEVVAGEIKKLSDQSKKASISISSIIKNTESNMKKTISSANDTYMIIKEQIDAVKEVNGAFTTILKVMDDIKVQLKNVDISIEEMDLVKRMTLAAIEKISEVSIETAATAEEVSATTIKQAMSAKELSGCTQLLNEATAELTESVEMFKI